jgi:hypothetical protein
MKNFKCLLLAIPLFFMGCSTNNTTYFRSSAAILTNIALNEAVSEEDRVEKAKIILHVAVLIETLTEADQVSVEELATSLNNLLPQKPHWDEFVSSIILIYADYLGEVDQMPESQRVKAMKEGLNKIAEGCRLAAQRYVQ